MAHWRRFEWRFFTQEGMRHESETSDGEVDLRARPDTVLLTDDKEPIAP